MKNIAMAKSYIRQAEERVKHAEEALKSGTMHILLDNVKRQLNWH